MRPPVPQAAPLRAELDRLLDAYAESDQERVRLMAEAILGTAPEDAADGARQGGTLDALRELARHAAGHDPTKKDSRPRPCAGDAGSTARRWPDRCSIGNEWEACDCWRTSPCTSERFQEILAPRPAPPDVSPQSAEIERLLAVFFYVHAAAYERWWDSFDYDTVICLLRLTIQLADAAAAAAGFHPAERALFRALRHLSGSIYHQVLLENGMMADDPLAMNAHALRHNHCLDEMRREIQEAIGAPRIWPPLPEFARRLMATRETVAERHEAIAVAAEMMHLRQADPEAFLSRYGGARAAIERTLREIERARRYAGASQLRAHLAVLDRFRDLLAPGQSESAGGEGMEHSRLEEHRHRARPRARTSLRLRNVQGTISFGFHLELSDRPGSAPSEVPAQGPRQPRSGPDDVRRPAGGPPAPEGPSARMLPPTLDVLKDHFGRLLARGKGIGSFRDDGRGWVPILPEFPFSTPSDDPPPDVLQTAIGKEHFANLVLPLGTVIVRELAHPGLPSEDRGGRPGDGRLEFRFRATLIHYALGVGAVSFDLELPESSPLSDHLTISQYQILKNLACPYSAKYDIGFEDDGTAPARRRTFSRLTDVASAVAGAYFWEIAGRLGLDPRDTLENEKNLERGWWIGSAESWFCNLHVYAVEDEDGALLDAEQLRRHWSWPGLASYHRADRTTVDDWVGIVPAALRIRNLARLRAHQGDLFVISQNHALTYLPDDATFIALQYAETAKWVFLMRSMIMFSMRAPHALIGELLETLRGITRSLADEAEQSMRELEAQRARVYEGLMKLERLRGMLVPILEHVRAARMSPIADHGALLREAFECAGIPPAVSAVQERLQALGAGEQSAAWINRELIRRQEALEKNRNEAILILLTAVIVALTVVLGLDSLERIWGAYGPYQGRAGGTTSYVLHLLGLLAALVLFTLVVYVLCRVAIALVARLSKMMRSAPRRTGANGGGR